MASEEEVFCFSGPLHLRVVDWNNPHHRRSMAASLVRGVYVIERDRQENRHGQNALAPPWWEFFNFKVNRVLIDPDDQSFFGCIYELGIVDQYCNHLNQNYPKYVVAFRGTMNSQDLKLDLLLMLSTLQHSSRFQVALQCVQDLVWKAGAPAQIWLAGHSLGSAIALLVGRHMVRMSFHFETYLFNPPFTSLPFEKIKNEKLKHGARIATSILTAGIAAAVNINSIKPDQDKEFMALASWIPYMFLNPSDPICCEYIGHFDHREKMSTMGGKIGRIAAQNSIASVIENAKGNDCDAVHLVPSAYLTINRSSCREIMQAHELRQWWRTDVHLEYKLHQYR